MSKPDSSLLADDSVSNCAQLPLALNSARADPEKLELPAVHVLFCPRGPLLYEAVTRN